MATDEHLFLTGRTLDIVFDVDLGELVKDRHVIVRGITLGGSSRRLMSGDLVPTQAELHYEFVPGATEEWADQNEWWWTLSVADDTNSECGRDNFGSFDSSSGGASTAGTRQLGGQIPQDARRLTI